MERYVVTGSSEELLLSERSIVIEVIDALPPGSEVVSGAAPLGVDVLAAHRAQACGLRVHLVIPDAPFSLSLAVAARKYGWTYERTPGIIGSRSASYMRRNDRLAELVEGHVGLAFPRTSNEEQRSGTWATVRRFRKRDPKRIEFFPLDGAPPWREVHQQPGRER